MMSYERKRLLFHELVERRSREERFKFTREESSLLVFFFGRNINKLQAVVRCYSKHHQYGRARKAVTAMQASYRRWHLVFLLNENRDRRGTLLKVFRARLARKVERHKLKLFNKLFEEVRNYFLTSD
jgi:uncharacterized DUF497 family protein